jgi:hypothetical protein
LPDLKIATLTSFVAIALPLNAATAAVFNAAAQRRNRHAPTQPSKLLKYN